MKQYFLILAAALLSMGLAFVSCDKPAPEVKDDPVFPQAVTQTLEANGSYTLEVEGNLDWTVELKYDQASTGWFWIQDGNSKVYTVHGKAGQKVSVTVCAGEQTDFDAHSCTLEMTMDKTSQVIATFTTGTLERTFSLAYCQLDEQAGDYMYNESLDGLKYTYNEPLTGEKPAVPLVWNVRTGDYRRSVLVNANFDWQLKSKPEWLQSFSGGEAGETVEFELEGDPMKYPADDASADLVFCAKSNQEAVFTYTVNIPGCKEMFEISGFQAETVANFDGEIYEETISGEGAYAPVEVGITGSVLGMDNVKIYTFVYFVESQFSAYWDNSEENTSWIKAALAEWDNAGPVLQERNLNITITKNEGDEERKACILAIPADKAPESDYMIFSDGQNLDEKYLPYVVTTLRQAAYGSEIGGGSAGGISPIKFRYEHTWEDQYGEGVKVATLEEVTEENIETLAAKYAKYDKLNVYDYYPSSVSATYILTYYTTRQNLTQLSIPDFDPAMESVSISYYPKKEWLSYEGGENELSIWMEKPGADATQNYGVIQVFISMQRSYTIICLPEL